MNFSKMSIVLVKFDKNPKNVAEKNYFYKKRHFISIEKEFFPFKQS